MAASTQNRLFLFGLMAITSSRRLMRTAHYGLRDDAGDLRLRSIPRRGWEQIHLESGESSGNGVTYGNL